MRTALFDDLQEIRKVAADGRLDEARRQLEHLTTHRVPIPGDHLPCAELAMELGLMKVAERELQLELRDLRSRPESGRDVRVLSALAEVSEALGQRARAHSFRSLASRAKGEPVSPPPRPDPIGASRSNPVPTDRSPRPEPASSTSVRTAPQDTPKSQTTPLSPKGETSRSSSAPSRGSNDSRSPRIKEQRPSTQGLKPPNKSDVARFLHLFAGRENVHARQWLDPSGRGGYSPVQRPLTHELLASHFAGTTTLGVYQTRVDGNVTFFALDLDATKPALSRAHQSPRAASELASTIDAAGLRMLRRARELGLDLLLEDSGYKGRHLWGFLETPMPSGLMRNFVKALGRALAPEDERLALECFPKQEKLGSGQIGNLIKLPLGIHLKSGRRAQILDGDGEIPDDPWRLLAQVRRHRHDEIMEVFSRLRAGDAGHRASSTDGPQLAPPTPAEPDFVASDFQSNPDLRRVLSGCAVLRTLVERGLTTRRLNHDEQIVVRHTIGHLPIGVAAVNYVFRRCPEVGPEHHLKSVLGGNPISCPKIRKKIPQVTSKLPCNCHFGDHLDHYPTPNLHLRLPQRSDVSLAGVAVAPNSTSGTSPSTAAPFPVAPSSEMTSPSPVPMAVEEPVKSFAGPTMRDLSLDATVNRYLQLVERAHRARLELEAVELSLFDAIESRGGRYETASHRLEVTRESGVPRIRIRSVTAEKA